MTHQILWTENRNGLPRSSPNGLKQPYGECLASDITVRTRTRSPVGLRGRTQGKRCPQHVVTLSSTGRPRCCFTAVNRREQVLLAWHGRWRPTDI
ncbi:hypothetical protein AVEN_3759-1 [Araneus ventricosus]|uniref:Uncharacterized protein n=1 Tax=Araneus ventricosus TaxID=182803 RepID=A0A4Y2T6C3_ARAVE|nr:hypothetical protein AVEN_3759-1 [Araneus ventricosus]